jgi:tRNA A37 threonylcarbamoyltransferase TsaD
LCFCQKNIIDILLKKLEKAADDYGVKEIAIAGGVSANSKLRSALQELSEKKDGIITFRSLNIQQTMLQ